MRAAYLVPIAIMLAAVPVAAHDFWVQPARFVTVAGAPLPFTLLVGHGTFRQRWGVDTARVVRFDDVTATGSRDRRAVLHTQNGDDDGTLQLDAPGTHVIVLESKAASSVLPSIRFNDYLRVEGLTTAIAERTRTGRQGSDGREFYSRRAKALIQVTSRGKPAPGGQNPATPVTGQGQVTRPTGLKLEIVPQKNPYELRPGEALPVQILYEGRPLAGATVKLNNLDFDAEPIAIIRSDADGRASFNVPLRGRWQMNVVWTKVISGNPQADFDTIFSSLTFGFDPAS